MSLRSTGFFVSEALVAGTVNFSTADISVAGQTFSLLVAQEVIFTTVDISVEGLSFTQSSVPIFPNSGFFIF